MHGLPPQTFFRYVAGREPAMAALCSPVLAIPAKKAIRPVLGYLNEQELDHLLTQVDRLAKNGERDYVLSCVPTGVVSTNKNRCFKAGAESV